MASSHLLSFKLNACVHQLATSKRVVLHPYACVLQRASAAPKAVGRRLMVVEANKRVQKKAK